MFFLLTINIQLFSLCGQDETGCIKPEASYLHWEDTCHCKSANLSCILCSGVFWSEACQKCSVNCINIIKWKNINAIVKKESEEEKGTKKPPIMVLLCHCLAQSQVSFYIILNTLSRTWYWIIGGFPPKPANYPGSLNPLLQRPK